MAELDPLQLQSGSSVNKETASPEPVTATCTSPLICPLWALYATIPIHSLLPPQLIEEHGLRKLQAVYTIMRKLLYAHPHHTWEPNTLRQLPLLHTSRDSCRL